MFFRLRQTKKWKVLLGIIGAIAIFSFSRAAWKRKNCQPTRWWAEDACKLGVDWDPRRHEHDSWAEYRRWIAADYHKSLTASETGWPVVQPDSCTFKQSITRKYSCQPGQGEFGKFIRELDVTSPEKCFDACVATRGCVGFDIAGGDDSPVGDSCRLYRENDPRLGNGGENHREYCQVQENDVCHKAQVVISTTVYKSNNGARIKAQNLSLSSWEGLAPDLCALGEASEEDISIELKYRKMGELACDKNVNGLPYFGKLLQAAEIKANLVGAQWAGFSNGDIGFDESLVETLNHIDAQVLKGTIPANVLVIGQRCNARVAAGVPQKSPGKAYCGGFAATKWLQTVAIEDASLHDSSAEDYFFFRPGTINWNGFPAFIVGRPGFDNMFVQWILHQGFSVVDATGAILAMHFQTGGAHDGWAPHSDKYWNFCALMHSTRLNNDGPWQKYGESCDKCNFGYIDQAQWLAKRSQNGKVELHKKRYISEACVDPRRFETAMT